MKTLEEEIEAILADGADAYLGVSIEDRELADRVKKAALNAAAGVCERQFPSVIAGECRDEILSLSTTKEGDDRG